ncbi:MAG TPA: TolC family protein [Polyangia bacterium]|nr:TolC family protein [Polyangia bacterium]
MRPPQPLPPRRHRRVVSIACAFAAAVVATTAARADDALPSRLDLADAERLFLERGLDLLIAQASAEAAEGDVDAAGAHPNPGVDLSVTYTPPLKRDAIYSGIQSNVPSSLWGFGVGVTDNAALSDQLFGKHGLRVEVAQRALAAARFGVGEAKRVGLGQLRQGYVAAVLAGLDAASAKESLDTYDEQLELNQKRYDEGAINGLDLSRATQADLEARQTLDQAESGRRQAMAALLFLLGVRGATPTVTLATPIDYRPLATLEGATPSSLQDSALANRTDVKQANAALEQASAQVKQARRSRAPDVALSLGYAEQCSGSSCSSEPAVTAGVAGNVPLFYRQRGEIKRAESNAKLAERALDKTKAQVLADVTQAFAAYEAAKSQVERMEGKLLEQAKVSRDLAQHMYQRGAASFIDFMDAQRAYVASRLEYHQDLAGYWNAVFQLEQATGTTLR